MATNHPYHNSPRLAYSQAINDLDSSTNVVNCALLDRNHSPSVAYDQYWADVNADEITNTSASDTGYTAGGQELTTKSLIHDDSASVIRFNADDVSWSSSTIDAGYAVVYDDTGDATTSALIVLVDFGTELSTSGGLFEIRWDSNGIMEIDPTI